VRFRLRLFILALCMFALSCAAKHAVDVLDVEVGPNFSGSAKIKTCTLGAPNTLDVSINANGLGAIGECSFSDKVRIRIHRAGSVRDLLPDSVKLVKTGDGFVTEIEVQVPSPRSAPTFCL